ncbi:LpqN/LpqT family lipoprotein [Rhodococcus rhodnii]|uniref:Uncharacterized protein n=2 Tax=Rhodococcus rhodnii TaxID=38312 RepID=R7WIF9_9NOCA|nr:LpqN/LpqT family lipoprotein [Rhodococcus rhodnii]EOM74975.1 hypothetical protein Rrhod_3695 [Rhodococcus rhodnii LMG 5362]
MTTTELFDYIESQEATYSPCEQGTPDCPTVLLPGLDGWHNVPVASGGGIYLARANTERAVDGWAPNAVVLQGRLSRILPPGDLLGRAHYDTANLPAWDEEVRSFERWHGHPSLFVEGTYEHESRSLFCTTRYVLVRNQQGLFMIQLTTTIRSDGMDDLYADAGTFDSDMRII